MVEIGIRDFIQYNKRKEDILLRVGKRTDEIRRCPWIQYRGLQEQGPAEDEDPLLENAWRSEDQELLRHLPPQEESSSLTHQAHQDLLLGSHEGDYDIRPQGLEPWSIGAAEYLNCLARHHPALRQHQKH